MAPSKVVIQCVSQIDNCLAARRAKASWKLTPQEFNSPTFLLTEKLTKGQADMNAARSVRPLTAAANVNKNAGQSKKETNSDGFAFL